MELFPAIQLNMELVGLVLIQDIIRRTNLFILTEDFGTQQHGVANNDCSFFSLIFQLKPLQINTVLISKPILTRRRMFCKMPWNMQSWEVDLSQRISYLNTLLTIHCKSLHYLLKKTFFHIFVPSIKSNDIFWQWSVFLYNQHLKNWLNLTCSLLVQTSPLFWTCPKWKGEFWLVPIP